MLLLCQYGRPTITYFNYWGVKLEYYQACPSGRAFGLYGLHVWTGCLIILTSVPYKFWCTMLGCLRQTTSKYIITCITTKAFNEIGDLHGGRHCVNTELESAPALRILQISRQSLIYRLETETKKDYVTCSRSHRLFVANRISWVPIQCLTTQIHLSSLKYVNRYNACHCGNMEGI